MTNQDPQFANPAHSPADPPSEGGQAPRYGQAPQYGQPAQGAPAADPYGPPVGARFGTPAYGADAQYGAPVAEPAKFRTLLKLTLLSAVLYLLSSIPSFFTDTEGQTRAQLEQAGMSPEEIEQTLQLTGVASVIGVVATLLVGLGLYALVYFGLKAVKNWARILGIVLAILSVVGSVLGVLAAGLLAGLGMDLGLDLSSPLGILGAVLSLAALVVNILWLVNAFNKDVAAYTQQGRRRAGGGVLRRWRDHADAPGRTPSRTASMEACPPRSRSRRP